MANTMSKAKPFLNAASNAAGKVSMKDSLVGSPHQHAKHARITGAVSCRGFRSGKGIPQGDLLSMLVAAAASRQWADRIPQQSRLNHVFVDDRPLLHDAPDEFCEVCNFTQIWDSEHKLNTKPKTLAFGTNPPRQNVEWLDGELVKRAEGNLVYLGAPLPFLAVKGE